MAPLPRGSQDIGFAVALGIQFSSMASEKYCACIPILGFNSGGYDINTMLEYGFLDEILKRDPNLYTLKTGKRYKAIETTQLLFLDEMLYCAGGTSLERFLACYSTSKNDQKFHFPYRWLDSYDKLDYLVKDIPIDGFDNDIKKTECSIDEYNEIQKECENQNLIRFIRIL